MSTITYSNNIDPTIAPPLRRRRGGVLGGNQFNNRDNQFNNRGNQFNNGGNQYNNRGNYFNNRDNQLDNQYNNYRGNQSNFRNSRFNVNGPRFNYRNNPQNYQNYQNYPNRGNFYRRNVFYNQNYQPQRNYNGYGIISQQRQGRFYRATTPRRSNQNRPRSRSNQRQRSQSRPRQQQQQQRRRGPRQLRLNDFMPPELRDDSPSAQNLPPEFNLATTATTTNAPPDALPQRQNFARTTASAINNSTQPFVVNTADQNQQRQNTTTSYRRRQRRIRTQQYQDNNRFAIFNDNDTDIESNVNDYDDDFKPIISTVTNNNKKKNKKNVKKSKPRAYLDLNRILAYLKNDASVTEIMKGRGSQAYVLAATSIYDTWVRNNYELQVWEKYLKIGTENKHWAKEVVQRTKKRDNTENIRFIKKKINQLFLSVAQSSATISDLRIQLGTYLTQIPVGKKSNKRTEIAAATTTTASITTANTTTADSTTAASNSTTISPDRARGETDKLETAILKYIQHCTQHVKKSAEARIQLAKAQMDEYKALEDFEQIATPAQWNIHLTLKTKIKLWSTKNKNYQIALKRVEYDLLPKFIDKTELSFKIDESIINQDEAQVMYNEMRQITRAFRMQAMTLYVQSLTREHELLSNEINRIIEGFPQENDEGFDAEPGYAAFKQYHELREKRLNLEVEQSLYFLSEQRVEGEPNNQGEEDIIAPTPIRSLGEEFLLQQ